MNILLTGATGFVGQHFLQYSNADYNIITASVREDLPLPDFTGIDAVVHLGGKAHEMKPVADEVYFTANAELTKRLAVAAKTAGIKHFIYASSVKVYGNIMSEGVDEFSECRPDDAYGKSKLLAEQYLQQLADETFIISIVRPPLVYGSGVKGNMLKLLHLVQKGIPLPFGNIDNKRSMVFVGNLVALIDTLLKKKAPGIFIAGDAAPTSVTYLIVLLRKYSGKKPNLIYVPRFVQMVIKRLRYNLYIRLYGSFVIDNTSTNKKLKFEPPYSTEEGIESMVKWFKTVV